MVKRNEDDDSNIEFVSKSQRKRDAQELKSLALTLIRLDAARLAQVPMDDDVREAIEEARRIRSNVARKRQLQYAAKLLRRIDPAAIAEALDGFDSAARHQTASLHRCEGWRDFLIESGDPAVGKLMSHDPRTDSQALRQLIRNARRESASGKPPASARRLFKILRDMDESEPLPPIQA